MSEPGSAGTEEFGSSAIYRIVVRGALTEAWKRRLSTKFAVESAPAEKGESGLETTLTGRMEDEAELLGLLDTLYDLHLPLLLLLRVDDTVSEPRPTR